MPGCSGNNREALKLLETALPVALYYSKAFPILRYQCLNSLGVEYAACGLIDEVRLAINVCLSSPFLPAFPQWKETSDEIALLEPGPRDKIIVPSCFEREEVAFESMRFPFVLIKNESYNANIDLMKTERRINEIMAECESKPELLSRVKAFISNEERPALSFKEKY